MAQKHEDDGLVVLGINAWNERSADIKRFVAEHKLAHRILLGGADVARQYGVSSLPTLVWIDRNGAVSDTELGFSGAKSLERKTRSLLASGP